MQMAKQATEEMLHQLPENSSFEDIQYHLYVLGKVQRGLDDADNGRTSSQNDVETRTRMRAKWQK